MVQCGSGLGLALEAGQRLGVSGDVIRQELEGDKAMQTGVFGFVDHTHAAATDLLDNAVVRDGPADHQRAMLGGKAESKVNGRLHPLVST